MADGWSQLIKCRQTACKYLPFKPPSITLSNSKGFVGGGLCQNDQIFTIYVISYQIIIINKQLIFPIIFTIRHSMMISNTSLQLYDIF